MNPQFQKDRESLTDISEKFNLSNAKVISQISSYPIYQEKEWALQLMNETWLLPADLSLLLSQGWTS